MKSELIKMAEGIEGVANEARELREVLKANDNESLLDAARRVMNPCKRVECCYCGALSPALMSEEERKVWSRHHVEEVCSKHPLREMESIQHMLICTLLELVEAYIPARSKLRNLKEVLEDMKTHGTRFDMHPTKVLDENSSDENEAWWHNYIKRIDESIKARATAVLAETFK